MNGTATVVGVRRSVWKFGIVKLDLFLRSVRACDKCYGAYAGFGRTASVYDLRQTA